MNTFESTARPALAATYTEWPPFHSSYQLNCPYNFHNYSPLQNGHFYNMVSSYFHIEQVNIFPVYYGQ